MVELRDLHEHLEQQARERAARLLEQERRLAVLAERNRLAGEIHDTLAQGFTGILMQLRAARQVMAEDPAAADLHLARAAELARKSLDEARRSVWDLWSQGERREDLSTVLARVAERLQSAGLKVQLQLPVAPTNPTDRPLIDAHAAIHVARIAEEAAANIVDHAQARRVTIRLERLKAAGATLLALEITDDGCGFDPAYPPVEPPRGFGLISMRHRAEQIGGQLTIDSAPGRGTRLRLVVPERGGP
ncbi:MAG TPA: sensor histidine kinase, partial [Bacillota bacterium]